MSAKPLAAAAPPCAFCESRSGVAQVKNIGPLRNSAYTCDTPSCVEQALAHAQGLEPPLTLPHASPTPPFSEAAADVLTQVTNILSRVASALRAVS